MMPQNYPNYKPVTGQQGYVYPTGQQMQAGQMQGGPWQGTQMQAGPWQGTPVQGVQSQGGSYPPLVSSGNPITPTGTVVQPPATPVFEQSYIENILRMNLGKVGTFYMTYENNSQWNAKIFKGVIEAAGRDHIIISDPKTGVRTILLTLNLDYITFDEPLNYQYPGVIGNPPRRR